MSLGWFLNNTPKKPPLYNTNPNSKDNHPEATPHFPGSYMSLLHLWGESVVVVVLAAVPVPNNNNDNNSNNNNNNKVYRNTLRGIARAP